jgi:hypothetical protein
MVMYIGGKMSETMTRKQLYLPRRLNQFLKRASKQRGISESEVIRQALERDESATSYPARDSEAAWIEILRYVNERKAEYGDQGKPVQWNRQELYEEPEKGK